MLAVGNEAEQAGVCAIGSDFVAVVEQHDAWDWVDEGKEGIHKFGFVTHEVGRGGGQAGRPSLPSSVFFDRSI